MERVIERYGDQFTADLPRLEKVAVETMIEVYQAYFNPGMGLILMYGLRKAACMKIIILKR